MTTIIERGSETGMPETIIDLDDYTNRANVEIMLACTLFGDPVPFPLGAGRAKLRTCIKGIRDFWYTLEPLGTIPRDCVYRVHRYNTEGQTALVQTVKWLQKYGVKNPIVWCSDD